MLNSEIFYLKLKNFEPNQIKNCFLTMTCGLS